MYVGKTPVKRKFTNWPASLLSNLLSRIAYKSLYVHGCTQRRQYSATLPLLPLQRAEGLCPCSSIWKQAVDLHPSHCCWTVLRYRKFVPKTCTRCSTTFIPPCGCATQVAFGCTALMLVDESIYLTDLLGCGCDGYACFIVCVRKNIDSLQVIMPAKKMQHCQW